MFELSCSIELRSSRSHKRRFRCTDRCDPSSVEGGLALWLDGDGSLLHGYVLAKRQRLTWTVPVPADVVGSTKSRVYYTTPSPNSAYLRDLKSFRWR